MIKNNFNILDYYKKQSIITDPGKYEYLFKDLPNDVDKIVKIVQGLIIHPMFGELYGVKFNTVQTAEEQIREVSRMLKKITSFDASTIINQREPVNRLIGICRDSSVLTVSMLRYIGIPARVRAGYAGYFDGEIKNEDHWVCEYWDYKKEKWILIDPQLDDVQKKHNNIKFNSLDLKYNEHFYPAGYVWKMCRNDKARPNDFGFNKAWRSWRSIRSSVLLDLNALNRIELLPWDIWGDIARKSNKDLKKDELKVLDKISDLIIEPDSNIEEIIELYNKSDYYNSVKSQLMMTGVIEGITYINTKNLKCPDIEIIEKIIYKDKIHGGDQSLNKQNEFIGEYNINKDEIAIKGARQHNLKNINVNIPHSKLVVVTGVSGSGKSSLAFDTLYAEGQRRFLESQPAFSRRLLNQIEKPDVDHITGLIPAVAIDQKTISRNPRSSVGTITGIFDYLRVLYTGIGLMHCPNCGRGIKPVNRQKMNSLINSIPGGISFKITAPIREENEKEKIDLIKKAYEEKILFMIIDSQTVKIDINNLDKYKHAIIELIIDEIENNKNNDYNKRISDAVLKAIYYASGVVKLILSDGQSVILTEKRLCGYCDISFNEINRATFSYNSPEGMCNECNGLGQILTVDPDLIINKPELSILDGASQWWGVLRNKKRTGNWMTGEVYALSDYYNVDLNYPWKDLPGEFKNAVLYGTGNNKVKYTYDSRGRKSEIVRAASGAVNHINRLFRNSDSENVRELLKQYMRETDCPVCSGEKLGAEARYVTVGNVRYPEIARMTIKEAYDWIINLSNKLSNEEYDIAKDLLNEITSKLKFILNVGLHYLTLDRQAPTLSGGEGQRIRLASQLGSGIDGLLYILDEPSIGLHPRDHKPLLNTLQRLRDNGNTVVVVEHDADTMNEADWIIDIGPGAGINGGYVIAEGTPESIRNNNDSLTGKYLSGKLKINSNNKKPRSLKDKWLKINGASLNNLKNIDVKFPVGVLTCVTGVSGSGKSSLVMKTLAPVLLRRLNNENVIPGAYKNIEGIEYINNIIDISQVPIGRTPRSIPATYVGLFDLIRKIYASISVKSDLKFNESDFSFNTKGGRCESCEGLGKKKIEMHFMPDVWVRCSDCSGRRYHEDILMIKYKNKSISDVLEMDVDEAVVFFEDQPEILKILQTMNDVGLDYIKLGQDATTLSGGEAQRIKLSKELCKSDTGNTVYILDEPTTGLHFADIHKLLDVLNRLICAGNTVIVIEHNLEVIRSADWIIDMGPEGGDKGGYIIAEGTPDDIIKCGKSYTGKFLKKNIQGVKNEKN